MAEEAGVKRKVAATIDPKTGKATSYQVVHKKQVFAPFFNIRGR